MNYRLHRGQVTSCKACRGGRETRPEVRSAATVCSPSLASIARGGEKFLRLRSSLAMPNSALIECQRLDGRRPASFAMRQCGCPCACHSLVEFTVALRRTIRIERTPIPSAFQCGTKVVDWLSFGWISSQTVCGLAVRGSRGGVRILVPVRCWQ